MKQVRAFDPQKGGTQAGWCLKNVRLGYSIPALYNDAWQAWNNTQQHTGAIPAGLDVPLYYDYTDRNGNRYGHINVRFRDGRIWNDGRFFQSMQTFQNSMSNVRYVGWSTHVNNVRVLEKGDDMITDKDVDLLRICHSEIGGWELHSTHAGKHDATFLAAWKGKTLRALIQTQWANGVGFRNRRVQQMADYPKLQQENKEFAKSVKELTDSISTKDEEIKRLEAELALIGDDSQNLNKLGEILRWFVQRMGISK